MLRWIAVILLFIISTTGFADFVEVRRNALVKETPDSQGAPIVRALPGDTFNLSNAGQQRNGYYQVEMDDHRRGWIYRTLVRRHQGQLALPDSPSGNIGFDGRDCHNHLVYGVPHRSDLILCRRGYAIGYNFQMRTADWVSYYITSQSVHGPNVERLDNFRVDRDVPKAFRSSNTDYGGSGYDRGHMAPSASIDFSREANDETFLYSNMTPQRAGFNRNMMGHTGVWGAIEDAERAWVRNRDSLYIIAGTFYGDMPDTIGRGVSVPSNFFKIVFDPARLEAIAFWMPQDENTAHLMATYIVSIDSIEDATGFDFLSTIVDDIETIIEENTATLEEWKQD